MENEKDSGNKGLFTRCKGQDFLSLRLVLMLHEECLCAAADMSPAN
jgi:hypothetical protein